MTNPRYRVTASEIIFVDGRPLAPGAEYESIGWPPVKGVEPINEQAEKVTAFYQKHFTSPMCGRQTSPHSAKLGTIFLPHTDINPVDPATAPDHAPRYSAPNGAEFRTGNIGPGRVFCFLAWPDRTWDPENDAAREILAWLEKHGGDARMELSPWNGFDDTTLLPDLPEVKNPGTNATDIRPFETTSPWMREIEVRYLNPQAKIAKPSKGGSRRRPAVA